MLRVSILEPFRVEIEEAPLPEIQEDGQILVRTELSGVSLGTEKIYFDGSWEKDPANYPIYPGYEAVGIVEACGNGVTRFKPGDRVVTLGNHASYVLQPEKRAELVPAHLRPEKATLAILGATATHAVERGRIPYNGSAAIFGAGVLGLLLLQHAKLGGAGFVMVCDTVVGKLEVARELGADLVVNPRQESPSQALAAVTGELADVSYEVAGGAPAAMEEALRSTREHGRVLLLGGGDQGTVHFPYRLFFSRELTVEASRATGSALNFARSMGRIVSGQVKVDPIPTEIVPYTEIGRIYEALVEGDYAFIHLVLRWS